MDSIKNEFYVTLPSNSSMNYFPENTQSSYRTKLSSPLVLVGDWEVGLSEVFLSRNWFNIGNHNNTYSITEFKEENIPMNPMRYDVALPNEIDDVTEFLLNLNRNIERITNIKQLSIRFTLEDAGEKIGIEIADGFELIIEAQNAQQLLYMLFLPIEDITITDDKIFKYRPLTQNLNSNFFTIVNKNPKSTTKHIIPFTNIKAKNSTTENEGIFKILNANIHTLELQNYLKFIYTPITNEVEIHLSDYAELYLTNNKSNSLLRILNLKHDTVLSGINRFDVNPLLSALPGESIDLHTKEYYKRKKISTFTKKLSVHSGRYATPDKLFQEIKHAKLVQLPNLKVSLHIPQNYELCFGKGLGDMLGFSSTYVFKSGDYISEYPLELDGGITEIFLYTDIVASHHVGDSFSSLLRVVPCVNEKEEQIVKHYDNPVYFPLRKHFIDTIEIELKSSSGQNIIFIGGKTFVMLSFRRKNL